MAKPKCALSGAASLLLDKMHLATVEDWSFVADFDSLSKFLYIYDFDTDSLCIADNRIPWPVIWLMVRHNRKHIFVRKQQLGDEVLDTYLESFANRQRWAWHFRRCTEAPLLPRGRGVAVADFNEVRSPALEYFIREVSSAVKESVRDANARGSARGDVSNVLPLTRWAFQLFKQSGYVAWANDKEPGFTLLSREDACEVHLRILEADAYVPVDSFEVLPSHLRLEYVKLCAWVASVEDNERWISTLTRSLRTRSTIIAKLKCTVKTTKSAGSNFFRNLHACPSFQFEDLGRWLDRVLGRELAKLKHLLRDTRSFVNEMKGHRCDDNDRFCRLDLDDFFMSGSCAGLSDAAADIFKPGPLKKLVRAVTFFLLDNQYIRSEYDSRLFKVRKGSGMGLVYSGAVCDAALYTLAERPWATHALVQKKYAVRSYFRFRDDIFFITSMPGASVHPWLRIFRHRSRPMFSISVVEFNRNSVTMLAVDVCKFNGEVGTSPRVPKVAVGPVLSTTSGHHYKIHLKWPSAVLGSRLKLCSHDALAKEALDAYIARFRMFHSPKWLVERLECAKVSLLSRSLATKSDNVARQSPPNDRWIVLPWHPCMIHASMGNSLQRVMSDPFVQVALNDAYDAPQSWRLRASWKNHFRPLTHAFG